MIFTAEPNTARCDTIYGGVYLTPLLCHVWAEYDHIGNITRGVWRFALICDFSFPTPHENLSRGEILYDSAPTHDILIHFFQVHV